MVFGTDNYVSEPALVNTTFGGVTLQTAGGGSHRPGRRGRHEGEQSQPCLPGSERQRRGDSDEQGDSSCLQREPQHHQRRLRHGRRRHGVRRLSRAERERIQLVPTTRSPSSRPAIIPPRLFRSRTRSAAPPHPTPSSRGPSSSTGTPSPRRARSPRPLQKARTLPSR